MKHTDFILSPITGLIKETVSACMGIGDGMETSTIAEHILQSLFLQMTGFQEQKMKCICWEMATYDYEYRYKRFIQNVLGECSNYKEKNQVINDIVNCTQSISGTLPLLDRSTKNAIITSVVSEIDNIILNTNLYKWESRQYKDYKDVIKNIKGSQLLVQGKNNSVSLFQEHKDGIGGGYKDLVFIYDKVYRHRNRCAHNTLSYQENLPTLNKLMDNDYVYENYFLRYAMLTLIDSVTVTLYKNYLMVLNTI